MIRIVSDVANSKQLSRPAKLSAYLDKLAANTQLQGQYTERIANARTLLSEHLNGEWKTLVERAEAHSILQPMIKGGLA